MKRINDSAKHLTPQRTEGIREDKKMYYFVSRTIWQFIGVAATVLLVSPTAALAAIDCSGSVTLLGNSTLGADYTTNSSTNPCIIVPSGYDLDLHGQTITCTAANCAEAIKVNANNTTVEDTLNGSTGITGPFSIGVKDAKIVREVRIQGAAIGIQGTSYMTSVLRNVITGSDTCIDVELDNNTDEVRDNFCDADGGVGIEATGSGSPSGPVIETNYVRNYGVNGAFRNADTTRLRIRDNLIADAAASGDPFVINATNKSVTGNVCDVTTDALCPIPYPSVFP